MKLSLEETMNQLKARLEESEYKHSIVCEALETLLDQIDVAALPKGAFYKARQDGRLALNGVVDVET